MSQGYPPLDTPTHTCTHSSGVSLSQSQTEGFFFPTVWEMLWRNTHSWGAHGDWLKAEAGSRSSTKTAVKQFISHIQFPLYSAYKHHKQTSAPLHCFTSGTPVFLLLSCTTAIHQRENGARKSIRYARCVLNHDMHNVSTPGESLPQWNNTLEYHHASAALVCRAVFLWEQSARGSINIWDLGCGQVGLSYPTATLRRRYIEFSLFLSALCVWTVTVYQGEKDNRDYERKKRY